MITYWIFVAINFDFLKKNTYLQKAYVIYILKYIIYDSSLMVNIQEK